MGGGLQPSPWIMEHPPPPLPIRHCWEYIYIRLTLYAGSHQQRLRFLPCCTQWQCWCIHCRNDTEPISLQLVLDLLPLIFDDETRSSWKSQPLLHMARCNLCCIIQMMSTWEFTPAQWHCRHLETVLRHPDDEQAIVRSTRIPGISLLKPLQHNAYALSSLHI